MKNDLEILSKYESWFRTAVNCDYMRALWESDFKILVPIYEKWTGRNPKLNNACGKCKLNFMKEFGKLYFKNKELIEQEDGKDIERGIEEKGKVCKQANSRGQQPKSGGRRGNKKV